jgi:MFS family permease
MTGLGAAGRDDRGWPPPDGAADGMGGREPGESEAERWNRNFGELLQEIRVAQTGVQILFAFLLTLPFAARFGSIDRPDKVAYVVTLIAAAAASALLIAPVSYHRMAFRQGRKPELVRAASVLAECGIVCLLIAIVGAVFVVMDEVTGLVGGSIIAGAIGLSTSLLWYVLPMRRRSSNVARRGRSTS